MGKSPPNIKNTKNLQSGQEKSKKKKKDMFYGKERDTTRCG